MLARAVSAMEQLQLAFESRAFELAYQRTCRQVEAVCDRERLRQLRVHTLLLEEDNDDLHTQLSEDEDRIGDLERFNEQLQEDLEVRGGKLESAQGDLRIKSREIESLKAELNSLHSVTMDSTKLLTEKLTLARELSALKPELDHLRSQAASHQSLLAEKISSQRQLSTLQVELETEKRATQRALAKEGKLHAEEAKIESRFEDLQAELSKERRERQKIERESQKDSVESGNRIAALESRLDAFRNKLKSTKEQLKDAQTSLQTAQASNHGKPSRASVSMTSTTSLAGNPRKRAAAQIDDGTILGTPGDLPARGKSKRGSTLIGEKSTFSVTPFLSRAASVAPESLPSSNACGDDEEHFKGSDRLSGKTNQKETSSEAIRDLVDVPDAMKDVMQAKKPGILQIARKGKINSRALPARKTKAAPSLEQVAEENIWNDGSTTSMSEPAAIIDSSYETFHGGLEMKRKKRKLLGGGLGKTLFDEDEGDALKVGGGLLGGVRGFGTLEKGGPGAPKFGLRKATGPTVGTFDAISPLKKDRKIAR